MNVSAPGWQLAMGVFRPDGASASLREPDPEDLQYAATVQRALSRIGVVTSIFVPPLSSVEVSEEHLLVRADWPFAPPRALENSVATVLTPPGSTAVVEHEGLGIEPAHLIEMVENVVLNHWVAAAGMKTGRVTGRFRPGADSALIAQIETPVRSVVVKAGPAAIVKNEVQFIRRVERELPDELSLFPKQFGLVEQGDVAAALMEAADPKTLDEHLFTDLDRSQLGDDFLEKLGPFLDLLTALHEVSAQSGIPEVGPYVYRDRFTSVTTTDGFKQASAHAFPEVSIDDVLESDWAGSDGTHLRGLRPLAARLVPWTDTLVPESNSIVHGDPHLKNMLSTNEGRPVFIDPRTVWDGNRRRDEGRGDPAYDFATLFHSIWPMSAILQAVECGTRTPATDIVREGTRFRFNIAWPASDSYRRLESKLVDLIAKTGEIPSYVARARLYVGTANALVGWLRYPDAVPTRDSWASTYIAALHFLDSGINALERGDVRATVRES